MPVNKHQSKKNRHNAPFNFVGLFPVVSMNAQGRFWQLAVPFGIAMWGKKCLFVILVHAHIDEMAISVSHRCDYIVYAHSTSCSVMY